MSGPELWCSWGLNQSTGAGNFRTCLGIRAWNLPSPGLDWWCRCSIAKSCPTLYDPWTAALQVSLSFTIMPIELVMLSNHLILCHPLLLLPSIFPNLRVFSNESALYLSFLLSCSVVSDSGWPQALPLLCPWEFPGKNTGVGCHSLLHYFCLFLVTFQCSTSFFQGNSRARAKAIGSEAESMHLPRASLVLCTLYPSH